MTHEQTPLIDAKSISRTFGAVKALTDVSVDFRRGEVHGLVGANGAGKSTFLNVLAGAITPSSGTILVDGEEVRIHTPAQADALGFAFIHQELALIPDFNAIDNMTLGIKSDNPLRFEDRKARAKLAREVADRLGLAFSLRRPVRELSVAERGMVAIGRALARDARFIAMDEPTAALSDVECQRLFQIVRQLTGDGVTIAYVSHRLNEIELLGDRVTVFKDGKVSGRFDRGGYDRQDLIKGITGLAGGLELRESLAPVAPDARVVLDVQHLSDGRRVKDVSFTCRAGEILGLAGVVGAGRSETLGLVFGDRKPELGTMSIDGKAHAPSNVQAGIAAQVALVPEERRSQALVMEESIRTNITLGNWKAMRAAPPLGFISDKRSEGIAKRMIAALSIKAKDSSVPVRTLSGGNQQKVVFGRWLARDSKVLLLDEPTRGVDIGARQQIWQTVENFAAAGGAIVVVSSELEELSICHRVVVMVEGRTVAELEGPGVTEEQMLSVIYSHNHEAKEAIS
ncbi:MAG: Monosaccharide transporter ATP-binding protein family [Naasia sp.]|jgi:ribose transport system ATP-binding protein|uniref:sugar ABC transporter ATP-binding protein n=1 Tax=Naasia sp. TaxID=2546198 RepID=UPI00261EEA62|nr:sugar ABC transporter ATP-binding protein [Naasia sp.]MCU1569952.1 Monosaccharide transporter ATP-binding protein family [Naasia sp.]